MDIEFTPRGVSKFVVSSIIAGKAKQIARDGIADYTRFEKDDLVTKISSDVAGGYVAYRLKPYTDKVVDKTADFINTKREARNAKKNKTNEQ